MPGMERSACRPLRRRRAPAATAADDRELATVARALGHPARVRILRLLLAQGGCVCGAIVAQLPLAQSTVSQHLKILRRAGLVVGEVSGPRACYAVDRERIAAVQGLLARL